MSHDDGMAQALVGHMARQVERDADVVAALTGTTEDLHRERAARLLGTRDPVAVGMTAARLRRHVRETGTVTPEQASALVAAEILDGKRTEIGREVEALLREVRP